MFTTLFLDEDIAQGVQKQDKITAQAA